MRKKIRSRELVIEKKVYRYRVKRKIFERKRNWLANRKKAKKEKRPKSHNSTIVRKRRRLLLLPTLFSFISNPLEVMKTFYTFREYAKSFDEVVLDFRQVEVITSDVIPILLAKVAKYQRHVEISGTRPENKEADRLLTESGFYNIVGVLSVKSSQGLLSTHKSKVVDTSVAVRARKLASERSFGDSEKKIQPLYRTLIECMANTRKHASNRENFESWWLSVYHQPGTKVTSFAFFDPGVGIFKSAKIENLTKFALKLGLRKNKDVLMSILEGKVASSTGLPYRGKGLPKIFSDYKASSLKKLHIAANDTFADFDNGTFIELEYELNGTFLYWEISPN